MAITVTILGTTPQPNGRKRVRASILCDNAYPVAGYDLSSPALFGFAQYEMNDAQTGFLDPVVTGVNQSGLLAEVKALKLLLSYPTGGAAVSPTPATTAPITTTTPAAGATAMTSTAAQPAMAGVVTPGAGKALAAATDASAVTVFVDAFGR